ncbi:unnamed protein product [Schistocephalus solidus]|uniref:DHC_N1 domain-containing protein n=1 Tax=Schistocephalus solidus TaxID=70667 RepID=A0A183T7K4_SCHSO|nr:unnamed protein product [Schistocephalus solidus]
MITSCKGYITDCDESPIWAQNPEQLLKRLNDCIDLNRAYQNAYKDAQDTIAEREKRLNFSKVQIFGDFDEFATRLEAIIHILQILKEYSILETVFIEGKLKILQHYRKIKAFITSRTYDYLDTGNTQFAKDFEYFGAEIAKLKASIPNENLMNAYSYQCTRGQNTLINLRLMMRMEELGVPQLGRQNRYSRLFTSYRAELEDAELDDLFIRIGRVGWARKKYLRLSEPMSIFWKQMPSLKDSSEGQATIHKFNKLCEALVGYEILSYRAWKKIIHLQASCMGASLFVVMKRAGKMEYVMNYDDQLRTLFREITCLRRFGCPMTPLAIELDRRSKVIKTRAGKLRTTEDNIDEFMRILQQAHDVASTRFAAILDTISTFKLALLPEQPEDLVYYLNGGPRDTGGQAQVKQGCGSAWYLGEIIRRSSVQAAKTTADIQQLSAAAYDAAQDYVNILAKDFDKFLEEYAANVDAYPDNMTLGSGTYSQEYPNRMTTRRSTRMTVGRDQNFRQHNAAKTKRIIKKTYDAIDETVRSFGQRTLDAITKAVRNTLEELWRSLCAKEASVLMKDIPMGQTLKRAAVQAYPVVKCEILLNGEKLVLKPSLEEIQSGIRVLLNTVLLSMKTIRKWTDDGRKLSSSSKAIQDKFCRKTTDSMFLASVSAGAGALSDLADMRERPSMAADRSSLYTGRSFNLPSTFRDSQSGASFSIDEKTRLAGGIDHFGCSAVSAEATLAFREQALF